MIKFDSLRVGLAMAASALVASCASFADPLTETLQPLGAWASGTDGDACETAPITYFSSDGVVLVLLSAKGPVHAIGSWDRNGDVLAMTHNDFPLDPSGQSKPAVKLSIMTLDADRFVTRNAKGDIRERIKCSEIAIKTGHDTEPH